jgi:hypothetical protein
VGRGGAGWGRAAFPRERPALVQCFLHGSQQFSKVLSAFPDVPHTGPAVCGQQPGRASGELSGRGHPPPGASSTQGDSWEEKVLRTRQCVCCPAAQCVRPTHTLCPHTCAPPKSSKFIHVSSHPGLVGWSSGWAPGVKF